MNPDRVPRGGPLSGRSLFGKNLTWRPKGDEKKERIEDMGRYAIGREKGQRILDQLPNITAEEAERLHGDALEERPFDEDHMVVRRKDEMANIFGIGEVTSDEDEEGILRPKLGEGVWGRGPPLRTDSYG